jgi:hypothetical protein
MEDAMPEQQDFLLPANLPVPVDDGAARHLRGKRVPITGVPAKAPKEGWDLIAGAPVFPSNESAEQALDSMKKHPA